MKYRITIYEITPGEKPQYDGVQKTIYDQTLERLDVAKVVIAANECIAQPQSVGTSASN